MLGLDMLGAVSPPADGAATTAAADRVASKAQKIVSRAKKAPKIAAYAKKAISQANDVKTKVKAAVQAKKVAQAAETKARKAASTSTVAKKAATAQPPTVTRQPVVPPPPVTVTRQPAPVATAPAPTVTRQPSATVAPTATRQPSQTVAPTVLRKIYGIGAGDIFEPGDAGYGGAWGGGGSQGGIVQKEATQAFIEYLTMMNAYGAALEDAEMILSLAEQLPPLLTQVQAAGLTDLYNEGLSLLDEANLYDPATPTDLASRGARWIIKAKNAKALPGGSTTTTTTDTGTYVAQVQDLLSQINSALPSVANQSLVAQGQALVARCNAVIAKPTDPNIAVTVSQLQGDVYNWLSLVSNLAYGGEESGGGDYGGGAVADYGGGGGGGGGASSFDSFAEMADAGGGGGGEGEYGEGEYDPEADAMAEMEEIESPMEEEVLEEEGTEEEYDPEADALAEAEAEMDFFEPVVGLRGLDIIGASTTLGVEQSKRSGTARDFGLLDMTYAVMLGAKLAASQPLLDRAKVFQGRVINQISPVFTAGGLTEEVEALALEVKKITNRNPLDNVYQGPVFTQTQNDYFSGKLLDTATHGAQAAIPEIKEKFDAALSGVGSVLTTVKWVAIGAVVLAILGAAAWGVSSFSKVMQHRSAT